jgi:hypothetical protein
MCVWDWVAPRRFTALVPPPDSAKCRPKPGHKRKAELRYDANHESIWGWRDHVELSVEHGCDRLKPKLASVVFEGSFRHDGSLELLRLDRRADDDWEVVHIAYDHDFLPHDASRPRVASDPWQASSTGAVGLFRGVLPAARIDPMLRRVREVLTLELREDEPLPDGYAQRFAYESIEFHAGVRLVDTAGYGVEHYVGGLYGEAWLSRRIRLGLAATEAWKVLGDEALMRTLAEAEPDDPAIVELFAGAFWAARAREPQFYGSSHVRERLFGLATPLGTTELVPALLEAMYDRGEAELPSHERSRVLAINALAVLTGFDLRYDVNREPRPVKEVTAEVLAACDTHAP